MTHAKRLGIVGLAALFCLFIVSPATAQQTTPTLQNETAARIYLDMTEFYSGLKSLAVTVTQTDTAEKKSQNERHVSRVRLMTEDPNRLVARAADDAVTEVISDGQTLYLYNPAANVYTEQPASPNFRGLYADFGRMPTVAVPDIVALLTPEKPQDVMNFTEALEYVGRESENGYDLHHLRVYRGEKPYDMWIDAGERPILWKIQTDNSQRIEEMEGTESLPQITSAAVYTNYRFNFAPSEDTFTFQPPESARKGPAEGGGEDQQTSEN